MRVLARSISLVLGAVLLCALPAAATAKPTVAILGLEVVEEGGVDAKTTAAAKSLTRGLREEAASDGGAYELAPDSAKDLLELKLLSDCSDEGRRCMADIGKELKADLLIYGKLEKTRNGYQISLKLLDTATAQMDKTTSDIVPFDDAGDLRRWARSFYARLSGAPEEGSLLITSDASGNVHIDGELKGLVTGGAVRITGLSPGLHRVTIEVEGGDRRDAEIEIVAGQEAALRIEAGHAAASESPAERPGASWRAAFWVAAGATAVGATAWTIEAYRYSGLWVTDGPLKEDHLEAVDELNGALRGEGARPLGPSDDACRAADGYEGRGGDVGAAATRVSAACERGQFHATVTTVLGIATGVSAVAAAYFYYRGYVRARSAPVAERAARRRARRPGAPVVSFVPAISPSTVGAGLAIEF